MPRTKSLVCLSAGCGKPLNSKSELRQCRCYPCLRIRDRNYLARRPYRPIRDENGTTFGIANIGERFWAKVEKTGGCWNWTAAHNKRGYGRIRISGKSAHTHRISWELHNGPIPEGLWVLHKCDNPPCVNPAHLFLGTYKYNIADMIKKGRVPRGESVSRAKLSWNNVEQIRSMYRGNGGTLSQRELSKKFGVGQASISRVVTMKGWNPLRGGIIT